MSYTLEIPVKGNLEELFTSAKGKAASQGVKLEGNSTSGTFSGLGATGEYKTSESIVTVTITKKPMMFPQAMVDMMIKKMFE